MTNDLEGIAGTGETPVSHPNTDKKADIPDACPGCALRDHQIDLLVRSRGAAIEAAFQSAARARAAEAKLGRLVAGGRAIPGLAELARAEAAG